MAAVLRLGLAALLASFAALAPAQSYPVKPVRLVVPFGAGGITDLVARIVAERLGPELGQPMVVENRPGAGGNLAASVVAKSAPDGYTLLMSTAAMLSVNPLLYRNLPFDPKDLAPVALVANTPHIVVVTSAFPATSLRELVGAARSKPDEVTFGTAGSGSSPHAAMELLKTLTDAKFVHVPYKSGAESVRAVAAGDVQVTMEAIPIVAPHIKSGRLRALAIAAGQRASAMPDLPAAAEAGVPGLETGSTSGLVAPAGTPRDIVTRLNRAVNVVLDQPQVRERLVAQGSEPMRSTPESFQSFIDAEKAKWEKVISASGMRVE